MIKFPYLRKVWQNNTAEERLLGVSMTGIMDNPLMTKKNKGLNKSLEHLRAIAVATNAEWAKLLGIPASTSISCVKPSGTVSQLVDSASGIHARHSPYYIRTVRGDNKDPLTQFMIDRGIPNEPCVMKPDSTVVFSFPVKSPEKSVTRNDMSAVEQLELWLTYQRHWCEHKPSVTITVRDEEWMEVGAFVYEYFDEMSGVSFLPHSDHSYQQAPYQEIDKVEYKELLSKMPTRIDWSELSDYESEDNTVSMQTMACSGDSCEIVDLVQPMYVVLGTSKCEFCNKAKNLLEEKGIAFMPYSVDTVSSRWLLTFMQQAGMKTVPQIWDNEGHHIGDYNKLKEHLNG